MECPRCRGLLVQDEFHDLRDDTGQLSFSGWRCVCCGNVLDPVIVRNRQFGMEVIRVGETLTDGAGSSHRVSDTLISQRGSGRASIPPSQNQKRGNDL